MSELKKCPFCKEVPEITKHFKEEMWSLVHRCRVVGPILFDWSADPQRHVARWNTRPLEDELVGALKIAFEYMPSEEEITEHNYGSERTMIAGEVAKVKAVLAKLEAK